MRPAVAIVRRSAASVSLPLRHLLAEPADDEQPVVDRQAEAEHRDDVDREDGDVGGQAEQSQHREGAEDRQAADRERQARRGEAAEDDDEQHQHDRQRDLLGPADVLAHLGGDVAADGRGAAEPDVQPAARRAARARAGRRCPSARRRRCRSAARRRTSSGGRPRRTSRRPGRRSRWSWSSVTRSCGSEARCAWTALRKAGSSTVRPPSRYMTTTSAPPRPTVASVCAWAPGRLAARRLEAAGDHRAEDPGAPQGAEGEEGPGEGQDEATVVEGDVSQPVEHDGLP